MCTQNIKNREHHVEHHGEEHKTEDEGELSFKGSGLVSSDLELIQLPVLGWCWSQVREETSFEIFVCFFIWVTCRNLKRPQGHPWQ